MDFNALARLIASFDCDPGLPESVFNAAYDILFSINTDWAEKFTGFIDATDGEFYLPSNNRDGWDTLIAKIRNGTH